MTDAPFLLNPANQAYLDGTKRRPQFNSQHGCLGLFASFFALVGFLLTLGVIQNIGLTLQLSMSGVVGQAVITDMQIDDSDDSTTYELVYEYRAIGQVYIQRDSVERDVYNATGMGERIDILYLPTEPSVSRVGSERPFFQWNWLVILLSGGFMVGGGLSVAYFWKQLRKEQRVTANGIRVEGYVIEAREKKDSDGDLWLTLGYELLSPISSVVLRGEQTIRIYHQRALPKRGSPVVVLYADDAHFAVL